MCEEAKAGIIPNEEWYMAGFYKKEKRNGSFKGNFRSFFYYLNKWSTGRYTGRPFLYSVATSPSTNGVI